MHFSGFDMYTAQHENATTTYFGGRGEYEYLWDLDCDGWPPLTLLAGIGTRIWNRNIFYRTADSGNALPGYAQAWWTIYPYVGAEKHWVLGGGGEFFASGRIGCTALTFTHTSLLDDPAFYPNPGITGQIQCGFRRKHLSLGVYFEAMSWASSAAEHLHGGYGNDWYSLPAIADVYHGAPGRFRLLGEYGQTRYAMARRTTVNP